MDMLTRKAYRAAQERAVARMHAAGLVLTDEEAGRVEVADFGLSRLEQEGAQILTWVATDRIAVKIIALCPGQTLPEHWHPRVGDDPGKEETVRVVHGVLRCYVPGADTLREGFIPPGKQEVYTARHELSLGPGKQVTLSPGTKHWFQAGPEGAVAYSFSSVARDVLDGFTDPQIERLTKVADAEETNP
jgi:D-lyxose ketol-isomerase